MRYKKYHINLAVITMSKVLPDLSSVHNNVLEESDYLKMETMPDGIVIYRAASPFSQLVSMHIPEGHPAFNYDIGVISLGKCYLDKLKVSIKDIDRRGDIRDLIFNYIIHPLFNSIPKNKITSWLKNNIKK